MGSRTSVFGALCVLGFVALHACSSDDKTGGGDTSGSGGDGGASGAPSGATGGASGTGAGSAGKGGSSGSSGGGSAGTGAAGQAGESVGGTSGDAGAGGEGATGPGADCSTCMTTHAEALQAQCEQSPSCSTWLGCLRGCGTAECLDDCDAATPSVHPYYSAIYSGLCDACVTQCSELALCDHQCTDESLPLLTVAPATLAGTGLYPATTSTPDAVAAYAREFHPEFELWSDGATKRRWAYIPRCGRINTEGMNHWLVPVGARFWKEFSVPGSGAVPTRVETRFLHHYGPDEANWIYAAYQWPANNPNPTAADAVLVDAGVMNANGTTHDIPPATACPICHGLPEKVLGFSAIQLSHDEGGVTIQSFADDGWLTNTETALAPGALARNGFDPPGTVTEQRVLGYLHANCGNCHHAGTIWGLNGTTPAARMRLSVGTATVALTDTYTTLVNQPTTRPFFAGCDRIEPGNAALSEIILRMSRRDVQQMPPLATEVVHTAAVDAIRAWINLLPASGTPSTCVPPP